MQNREEKAQCIVRRAADTDMEAVLALTAKVFEGEQDIPREMNPIPAEKQPRWWCMEQDGELVGTAAVYREGGRWHMGRITVAPRLRGQHKGTFLLESVLTDVLHRMWITFSSKRGMRPCISSSASAHASSVRRCRSIAAM